MNDDIKFGDHIDQFAVDESLKIYNEGLDAFNNADYEMAYELLQQSLQIRPHAKTYERIYMVLKCMKKNDEALSNLKKACELNPKNNHTATLYAEELLKQGELSMAVSILNDVLKRNTTYGPAKRLLDQIGKSEI